MTGDTQKNRGILTDILLIYATAIALTIFITFLKPVSPVIRANAGGIVAAGFILIVIFVSLIRKENLAEYGLRFDHWKSEILLVISLCIIIFPIYILGFKIYWQPPSPFALRFAINPIFFVMNHFLVVAIPEELLFRGIIQQRLGLLFKKRINLPGFSLGMHIPVASFLFALGHLASNPNPARLATFFPALIFGCLKERRGTLIGCTLFHALCNIFSDIVVWGYFGIPVKN